MPRGSGSPTSTRRVKEENNSSPLPSARASITAGRRSRRSRLGGGGEAADRFGFAVVAVEHRHELRDHQQILQPLGDVNQLQRPAAARRGLADLHELAKTGAVDIGHASKVEENLLGPLLEQTVDLVLEEDIATLVQCDIAVDGDDGD